MYDLWIIWLIIAGFSFLLEIMTVGFIMFWVGLGAIVALIAGLFGASETVQIILFAISSIIFIALTKPLISKYVKTNNNPTNTNALIGKKGLVVKEINNIDSKGQVKVGGELWSAISQTDETITKDENVEIVSIKGVKLIVKKTNKPGNESKTLKDPSIKKDTINSNQSKSTKGVKTKK